MKLGVIFGGMSTEHDVSIVSGTSVISHLNRDKYDIYPIYVDEEGKYYEYLDKDIKILKLGEKPENLKLITNVVEYLKNMDVVFPVLHGLYGEDGTIQGLLELIKVPYVGCKILASSLCMDKVYTKNIFRSSNINVAKYMYIKKYQDKYIYIDENFNDYIYDEDSLTKKVEEYLNFPVFIKPSNQGSSVGVNKSEKDNFINLLEDSFKYDKKILIEEEIIGREIECAILGNDDLIVSIPGEIKANGEFYTFDSKYKDDKSKTLIPDDLSKEMILKIQTLAKKAYKACDCKGLARVDFFIDKDNKIIINEINTMPGFTEISMYPKLMAVMEINYSELLDKLIELALENSN